MKKFLYKTISMAVIIVSSGQFIMAQTPVAPLQPSKPEAPEKAEQTEIVIRQKGDKDTKITLEIKNGDYFINGKPLEKFDDENVIVEKRDLDDVEVNVPQSVFRVKPWNDERMERELNNTDMQRKIQKSIQVRMNSAFLGVSSQKAEKGGATVLEVSEGSPAEKAGIKKGDIITKVNETKIESPENLFETIHNLKPGDKVKILLSRKGKEQSVVAVLDKPDYMKMKDLKDFKYNYNYKMPPMPPMLDMNGLGMDGLWGEVRQPKIGIKAQDAEDGKGVIVLEVEDSSSAARAGLIKGDIIVQFDGTEVNSTNELIDQLREARKKSIVKVKILRGGESREIEIKIPRKLRTAEL